MNATTDWEILSKEASQDRRKEVRIPLVFPIEVAGFNRRGRFFSERTATADVSASGCRFRLRTEVECGAVVAVKVVSRKSDRILPNRPLLFQIARVEQEEELWTVGAAKLEPENIWCVAFPAPQQPPTPVA